MTFTVIELFFANTVPAVNQYTKSFIRSQNNQFLRTYWHQVSLEVCNYC